MADETPKFYARRHYNKVLASARSQGFKGATIGVLRVLCWEADFTANKVRISQAYMADETGYHIQTIKKAIKTLRNAGIIIPIAAPRGGRNKNEATMFKLHNKKPIGYSDATNSVDSYQNGYSDTTPMVAPDSQKGSVRHPQPYLSNISKKKDAPGRGETNQGKDGKLNPEQQELMVLLRTNNYSEARRIMDERKRA